MSRTATWPQAIDIRFQLRTHKLSPGRDGCRCVWSWSHASTGALRTCRLWPYEGGSVVKLRVWVIGFMVIDVGLRMAVAQVDDMKAFPQSEAGAKRIVIRVPSVFDADDRRVEVLVGKTLELDCNRQLLVAQVRQETAKGWGYPYYVVSSLLGPATTQMACPPGSVTRSDFVAARTVELAWLPYNPRSPIVVYVPDDVEVRYRVWHVTGAMESGKTE